MHWGYAHVVVGVRYQPVNGPTLFNLQKFIPSQAVSILNKVLWWSYRVILNLWLEPRFTYLLQHKIVNSHSFGCHSIPTWSSKQMTF